MRPTRHRLALALALAGAALAAGPAAAAPATPVAEYRGAAGVRIVSYCPAWAAPERLQAVYNELMANLHGAELALLDRVEIHPGGPEGLAGRWFGAWRTGPGGENPRLLPGRHIAIYHCEDLDLPHLAQVLSHEYGHHFTYAYLMQREGRTFAAWQGSQWARLRGLDRYPQVGSGPHAWDPAEIAADDYVLLFGSSLARRGAFLRDGGGRGRLHGNLALPLATEVPGLRQYWLEAAGLEAPPLPVPPPPRLWLESVADLADLAGWWRHHPQITLAWAPGPHAPPDTRYYLWLHTDDPDQPWHGGALWRELGQGGSGGQVLLGAWPSPDGRWWTVESLPPLPRAHFLVVAERQGAVAASNRVVLDLSNPAAVRLVAQEPFKEPPPPFSDLQGHWAAAAVRQLWEAGAVAGYPDGRFYPDRPLSRAAMIKLVAAALGLTPRPGVPQPYPHLAGHWLATGGWIQAALAAGLVQPGDYPPGWDPDAPMPRQELARLAVRAVGGRPAAGPLPFADAAQVDPGLAGYVAEAARRGLLVGFANPGGAPTFQPLAGSTRAQGAAVAVRILDQRASDR